MKPPIIVVVDNQFKNDSTVIPPGIYRAEIKNGRIQLISLFSSDTFSVPLDCAQFLQSPLSWRMLTMQRISPFFPEVCPHKYFITDDLRIGVTPIISKMSFMWFASDKCLTINIDDETKKIQKCCIPQKTGFFFGSQVIEYDFRFLKPYIPGAPTEEGHACAPTEEGHACAPTEEVHACVLTEEANDCNGYPSQELLSGSAKSRGCLPCCIQ